MNSIDTKLFEQYIELLGVEGLSASIRSFQELMPVYADELQDLIHQRESSLTRQQAHKMKGACRSLGFVRLAKRMEYIEKEAWNWEELEGTMTPWLEDMSQDLAFVIQWLKNHA